VYVFATTQLLPDIVIVVNSSLGPAPSNNCCGLARPVTVARPGTVGADRGANWSAYACFAYLRTTDQA
jgi:hypothetical protein